MVGILQNQVQMQIMMHYTTHSKSHVNTSFSYNIFLGHFLRGTVSKTLEICTNLNWFLGYMFKIRNKGISSVYLA